MEKLTKYQKQILNEQTAAALSQLDNDVELTDVLAGIYSENTRGETHDKGIIIAEEIIDDVNAFDRELSDAMKNSEHFVDSYFESLSKDKSCLERCRMWDGITRGIITETKAACETAESAETEKTFDPAQPDAAEEISTDEIYSFTEEEVSEELEHELKEKAKEAVKNSGILFTATMQAAKGTVELSDGTEEAEILLYYAGKELEYRSVFSMLAYVNIKNGTFDNICPDITAKQTVTLVCAHIEEMRIMEAAGKGAMAEKVAADILAVLGTYVVCVFELTAAVLAAAGLPAILLIPGIVAAAALINYTLKRAYIVIKETSDKICAAAGALVKTVVKGMKKVYAYVKENIIPKITDRIKKISANVKMRTGKIKSSYRKKVYAV